MPGWTERTQRHHRRPSPVGRLFAAYYDWATAGMEARLFGPQRRRLLTAARGRVLDIGAGTGANLPYFPWDAISELTLLDPSAGMLERAQRKAQALGVTLRVMEGRAERLPFEAEHFDTVVFTLSLCTVGDPAATLREAHRVLRPQGRLLVFEHVRAHDGGLATWQDRLTPLWKSINAGCHPNRDTRAAIEGAGFAFEWVEEYVERGMPLPIVQPQLIGCGRKAR
jgi:ubiquinone/menaquinone biosynthesis C-methylase UbiE